MATVRCILFSNDSGSKEGVYFTEDMEIPAEEFCPPDCTISGTSELSDSDLPSCFPLDRPLMKEI